MPKFRVSVDMVRCCDLYVDAPSADDAKRKVLEDRLWREENSDAWCDGHEGTQEIGECAEVDEDGNER